MRFAFVTLCALICSGAAINAASAEAGTIRLVLQRRKPVLH